MTREEAIKKIKSWDFLDDNEKEVLETLIPELKESKDERIRKKLITYFQDLKGGWFENITNDDIITWLKKQGEKPEGKTALEAIHEEKVDNANKVGPSIIEEKPVNWSDDDEQYLLICKNALRKYQVSDKWDAEIISKWLEDKLKQGEPKTKWTEEDERGSDETIELLEYFINYAPEFRRPAIRRSIDWLKSIKQRMEEQ